jgi:hypothetical protein
VNGGGPDVQWAPGWDRIDEDFDDHLVEIRKFLRCPTVSASDDDMLAGSQEPRCLGEVPALEEPVPGHRAACHVAAAEGVRTRAHSGRFAQPRSMLQVRAGLTPDRFNYLFRGAKEGLLALLARHDRPVPSAFIK